MKIKVTDEMVQKASEAYCEAHGMNPNNWKIVKRFIRIALEAALS